MPSSDISEFRTYPFIQKRLSEMGWNTKSPKHGGQVYTQNEATKQNDKLKKAFGKGRPEYVVVVRENNFWVVEAKADERNMDEALKDGKKRAKQINDISGIQCRLITGFAGNPDKTHYIETHCLVGEQWKPLEINNRQSTGFITPAQAIEILVGGKGRLDDYDIADDLFKDKMKKINHILHNGAFQKRDRAAVLACLLLALANDAKLPLNDDPTTLIDDINSRARGELRKYDKESFFKEININQPTSRDNHAKNRNALVRSVGILRDLNIASTINSGRDILGQCYEQFLKYANDAKEIGIVLTPRHITNFGAQVIDVQMNDVIFDPTCGTGGFLVAALDKVRKDNRNIDDFKRGNLYGVEQDALVATLAIVNMVFRGDGSSNITEGDSFKTEIKTKADKVLMNPPFALENEKEWEFVDKALEQMNDDGLLFAILPTSAMNSSKDRRGEITWRTNLLKRHTLIAVIKMPNKLFYPFVSKGTYGIIIQAHRAHDELKDKVVWAILEDGVKRTKTQRKRKSNTEQILTAIKQHIAGIETDYIPARLDCSPIKPETNDLSPECHIGSRDIPFDVIDIFKSIKDGEDFMAHKNTKLKSQQSLKCKSFPVYDFFEYLESGKSGRNKEMEEGGTPLISTSERNNGISAMVNKKHCREIYPAGHITISKNGGCGHAHYHSYEFAANSDVFVGRLKPSYDNEGFAVFLCSAINKEKWRYNYYTKLTEEKIKKMKIQIPINKNNKIDMDSIGIIVNDNRNAHVQ